MKSKRFDKNSWIDLGIKALSTDGPDSLTIDELCKKASKTKGSFYFHFKTIDDYLEALTQNWFEVYTIKITASPMPNTQRLDLMNQLVARLDLDLETGIRNLAARNRIVQKIATKADQTRIDWLTQLYVNSGKYNKDEAKALAQIEIAAFTGFRLIKPDMPPKEARELYEHFLKFTTRN